MFFQIHKSNKCNKNWCLLFTTPKQTVFYHALEHSSIQVQAVQALYTEAAHFKDGWYGIQEYSRSSLITWIIIIIITYKINYKIVYCNILTDYYYILLITYKIFV